MKPTPCDAPAAQILTWLDAILAPDDSRVELRATVVDGKGKGEPEATFSRLYARANLADLVKQAVTLSGRAEAVYFTLNPIKRTIKRAVTAAGILHRRLLLIDADPARGEPGKVSATDAEKAQAGRLAGDVVAYLTRLGWPAPVRGDSGNGFHSLYAIDLPNDDESRELVRRVLVALAHRFDTADAAIDTTVYDAGRICKLYGTLSRKGPPTGDRPHRASAVLEFPPDFRRAVVTREMLEAVAASAPAPAPAPPAVAERPARARPTGGREWRIEDRAIAYLEKCPGGVSGNKGHNQTFKTACKVGPGFDLAPDVAFRLLRDHWNPTCEPPWSDEDLRRKVDEAFKKEPRRGWLLNTNRTPRDTPENDSGKADQVEPDDDARPEILITANEMLVNNQAILAVAADPKLYCRGQDLVVPRREQRKHKLVNRPDESPWIAVMPRSTLRERLSHWARFVKHRRLPNSEMVEIVPAHPPDWAVAAISDRGDWDGIKHLEGIVEAPSLLSDGSILDVPGYDERSGLLFEPNCDFPPIPAQINQADARAAADELLYLVADFPFAVIDGDGGAAHGAAWLASFLTLLARHAIDGPCPLFLIDANVPGAGKTKLVDIAAILATGRVAARTAFPEHEEEMRKMIISIAIEGDRLILIDNVATGGALGGASLDGVLTGTTVKGRILGRSEMSREVPIYTVWYATGNNLGLKGDMLRRVLPYRIESPLERPEERTDFRIKGDLIEHVRANRGRLVVAALKILRGYFLAGRPQADLVPMDYPAWCGVVRQAIHWATGIDPCSTRRELIVDNPEAHQHKAIIAGWAELPRGDTGLTAAEAIRILQDPEFQQRYGVIRDALVEGTRDGKLPTPKMIGKHFKAIEDRVIDGMVMRGHSYQGTKRWAAVEADGSKSGGSGGFGGSVSPHAGKLLPGFDVIEGGERGRCLPPNGENTPTKATTPTKLEHPDRGDAYEGDLPVAVPSPELGPDRPGGGA